MYCDLYLIALLFQTHLIEVQHCFSHDELLVSEAEALLLNFVAAIHFFTVGYQLTECFADGPQLRGCFIDGPQLRELEHIIF